MRDAYSRLRELDRSACRAIADAWIGVFGTIMRLAPTGIPANTPYFAPYPVWSYLQQYANLHDPLEPSRNSEAQRLRGLIGESVLDAYLQTRARNYAVDRLLLDKARAESIDRLVLGQDDAKPYGLHVPEVQALQALSRCERSGRPRVDRAGRRRTRHGAGRARARARCATGRRASRSTTRRRRARRIKIRWSTRRSAITIDRLIALCGGVRDDTATGYRALRARSRYRRRAR